MKKTFIFDMDGTIVDTGHIWSKTNKIYLESKGITCQNTINNISAKVQGLFTKKITKYFKDHFKFDDDIETIVSDKQEIAHSLFDSSLMFIQGFVSFIKKAKQHNINVALATNASPEGLAKINEILNLKSFFGKHMYDISYVDYQGKPAPDIFLYAAKQTKTAPQDCLIFEDSLTGLKAAQAAKIDVIGIDSNNLKNAMDPYVIKRVLSYSELAVEELIKL